MTRSYKFLRSLSRWTPPGLRALVRRFVPAVGYDRYLNALSDPYAQADPVFEAPGSPCTLGILRDPFHYHRSYLAACRELGVSYRLLDLARSDWMRAIEESACEAFLVWPSIQLTIWKEMFDDRLRIMVEDLGKTIYPTLKETWLYESKRRIHDWLAAHNIPHPRTWVFYDLDEAREFVRNADLPLVFKTSLGASTRGVSILRGRRQAQRMVEKAFSRGILPPRSHPNDWQWGSVYLQEYLPNVQEWRMVRIGDSYFGYRKERRGDFHSASHLWSWLDPPRPLLDMLRRVTETGGFTSMDVDIFLTEDGRLLVSEMQTVFGASTPADQLRVDGKPGRYLYDEQTDRWVFEEGDFCRNECANARVEYLIHKILKVSPCSPCLSG